MSRRRMSDRHAVGDATPFGMQLFTRCYGVSGTPPPDFVARVVDAIGMTPIYESVTWRYPCEGKGGVGSTTVQPISESFVCLDQWTDHKGFYLIIGSCKHFPVNALDALFSENNLRIMSESHDTLKLEG